MRHTAQLEGSRISWVQGQLTRPRGQLPQRGGGSQQARFPPWSMGFYLGPGLLWCPRFF